MPISIHNKDYFTVAERLKMARPNDYEPPKGIKHITTSVQAAGNLVVVRAHITFEDGSEYSGHSLVNLNATSPAERDAPLETAETSAVGRALALAGWYGSPDGIAGAEELELAMQRAEARASAASSTTVTRYADGSSPVTRMPSSGSGGAAPRPVQGGQGGGTYAPSGAQVRYLNQLWEQANRPFPPPDTTTMDRRAVSGVIDELKTELGIP